MRLAGGWALLLLLAAGPASGEAASQFGAGAAVMAGSGGYSKLSLDADAQWRARRLDPYAWAQASSDNFVREFTMVAGAWKDLQADFRVKGGGGVIIGKFKDSNSGSNALLLETGCEKFFEGPVLGAEYRLTSGAITDSSVLRNGEQAVEQRAHGRRAPGGTVPAPESFTYSEVSGYGKLPVGETRLSLWVTLGLPSYSRSVLSETLGWRIPVSKPLSVTPAVTFEQGLGNNVYFSFSLFYWFS